MKYRKKPVVVEAEMREPLALPYRARCSGCRLTWDPGVPFDDHGKPHIGCLYGGVWIISPSEMSRLLAEAHRVIASADGALLCLTYDGAATMSDQRIREIAEKFRKDMKKLGLGVKIKAGDGSWITVTKPPRKSASLTTEGNEK